MSPPRFQAICFDWGGTLMSEDGPQDLPMAEWPEVRCISGAHETLALLHTEFTLCIATNASVSRRPMIERALDRVGLLQYVSHVFCFTELGCRKESAQFWNSVSERLQLPLEHVAMIGDTLGPDVLAPRRFGVFSVWFNEEGRQPLPSVAVPMITALPEFVALIKKAN